MKGKVRVIVLWAVIVSLVLVQAGCTAAVAPAAETEAGAEAVAEKTELVIWSVGAGNEDFQRALVQRFNDEHPDINLVYDPALAGLEFLTEGMQKLRIAFQNQAGPDIIGGVDAGAALQAIVESGQVMDLTDAFTERGWNEKFPQQLIDRVTIDGKVYALPINIETVGLFYNKDMFEEVGVTVPQTYSEYLEVLQKLTDAGYFGYAIGLAGGWPSAFMASAFMYLSAGSEYKAVLSAEKPWTDCDRCLQGLQAFYDIVESGYTNPEVLGVDQDQANDLFFQGQTAMTLQGPWTISDIWDAEPEFEVGFFYLPPIDPETDILTFGGEGGAVLVSNATEDPEAALEYIDWFFSEEIAQEVLRGGGAVEPIAFDIPEDIDPLLYQVTEETLKNIDSVGFWPVTYLAPQVFGQMNQFVQGMRAGQLTPEQVMEEMQKAHDAYQKETGG